MQASRQLLKFAVVGLGNTLLSLVVFELLATVLPGPAASGIAFLAGAVNGYRWNRRWTFAAADSTATRARYLAVQVGGLVLTSVGFWLLTRTELRATAAYLATIATVTLATFAANRWWAFTASPQSVSRPPAGARRILGA